QLVMSPGSAEADFSRSKHAAQPPEVELESLMDAGRKEYTDDRATRSRPVDRCRLDGLAATLAARRAGPRRELFPALSGPGNRRGQRPRTGLPGGAAARGTG